MECTDPQKMLVCLMTTYGKIHDGVSDRKGRLIACSCCRRLWDRLNGEWEAGRKAIEVVERFLEGLAFEAELQVAYNEFGIANYRSKHRLGRDSALEPIRYIWPDIWPAGGGLPSGYSGWTAMAWVAKAARYVIRKRHRSSEYPAQASIFRDVLGNPFRPESIDPAWQTSEVVALAQAAYEHRILPAGILNNSLLAVLADALEKAGCNNQDILNHCRQPEEHVRGCWPIDLILDKE